MLTTLADAETHTTPNATMRRYRGTDIAVWRTEMAPGAKGPQHQIDVDMLIVVTEGSVEIHSDDDVERMEPGDAVLVPAGRNRQVVSGENGAVTLTAARPGGVARTAGRDPVTVPWSK